MKSKEKIVKVRRLDRKELQPIMNNLLVELKEVLEKHNLRYWLWGGTLLGAAMYKGFIPWDDDIDIGMPREDYNKLIEIARRGELKNTLWCNELNKKFKYMFAKYCDDKTLVKENWTNAGKIGVFVDIFPVDGLGDTMQEARSVHKKIKPYSYMYWACVTPMKIKFWLIIPPLTPLFFMWRFFYNRAVRISKRKSFDNCRFVGMTGVKLNDREIIDRDFFDSNTTLQFEGKRYPAAKYEERLDRNYTPKWRIPQPESERKIHGFKAWEIKKQR
ncbi:MAG: LicD family protein [Firmicutes bacterium]|nr:LicD family protein [Bacillota bacterium]